MSKWILYDNKMQVDQSYDLLTRLGAPNNKSYD